MFQRQQSPRYTFRDHFSSSGSIALSTINPRSKDCHQRLKLMLNGDRCMIARGIINKLDDQMCKGKKLLERKVNGKNDTEEKLHTRKN